MKIHNIEFTIGIELMGLPDETYFIILNKFEKQIQKYAKSTNDHKLSFKELNKLFSLIDRNYIVKSIEYPEMIRTKDDEDFHVDTTTIEIVG
jgi:hypothetical protein